MRLGFILPLLLVAVATATAEADFEKLQQSYEAKRAKLDKPVNTLREQYHAQLGRLASDFQKNGDLDAMLAAKEQAKIEPDPEKVDSMPREIANAQKIYLRQKNVKVRQSRSSVMSLLRSYSQQLEKRRAALTKARKIDEAVVYHTEIKKISAEIKELEAATRPKPKQPELLKMIVGTKWWWWKDEQVIEFVSPTKAKVTGRMKFSLNVRQQSEWVIYMETIDRDAGAESLRVTFKPSSDTAKALKLEDGYEWEIRKVEE